MIIEINKDMIKSVRHSLCYNTDLSKRVWYAKPEKVRAFIDENATAILGIEIKPYKDTVNGSLKRTYNRILDRTADSIISGTECRIKLARAE